MSSQFSSFLPEFSIEIMAAIGGDKNDPNGSDPDQQSAMRLWSPKWSPDDVDPGDIPLSSMSQSPTQSSQQQFPGVLDPGSLVYVLKQAGDSVGVILGMANQMQDGKGGSGGQNIFGSKPMQEARSREQGISIPPQIEEKTENGVKIRKIKEKDEEHRTELLDGLPIHASLFEMVGFNLPELKNIATAKQTNDGMVTNQMMQQMMGSIMSMGQMMQGLMKNGSGGGGGGAGGLGASAGLGLGNGQSYMDDIRDNIRKNLIYDPQSAENIITAMTNLTRLIQGFEASSGGSHVITGNVVHYTIFLENATKVLSQVTSIADLMAALNRLQSDTSLHGHDKLEAVEYTIDTAHGIVTQRLWYDGELEIIMDANTMNNINNWANVVTDPASSPGAGYQPSNSGGSGGGGGAGQAMQGIQQMFGKSSQLMQEMFKRLTPKQEKEAKKMHQKLNQGGAAQKQNDLYKAVAGSDDGVADDPLNPNKFLKSQDNFRVSINQ